MTHVATLISNPAHPAVTDAVLRAAERALPHADVAVRLDGAIAADLPLLGPEGTDPRSLAEVVRAVLDGAAVDVVVQPMTNRRKKLFVADMDSTMIGQECIDELAEKMGLKAEVAAITERAMRGELVFEPALRERVALLKGLPIRAIDDLITERIRPTAGARVLVRTMREHGAYTCLVSGGFTLFTNPVAETIGFDENRANRLAVDAAGLLLGRVHEPILGPSAKLDTLHDLMAKRGVSRAQTLAAGDGANDVPMLKAAGLGVAYHAKPIAIAAAHARIDFGDLTALLYLQGYRRDEFFDGW